jgi:hypothetical protein
VIFVAFQSWIVLSQLVGTKVVLPGQQTGAIEPAAILIAKIG